MTFLAAEPSFLRTSAGGVRVHARGRRTPTTRVRENDALGEKNVISPHPNEYAVIMRRDPGRRGRGPA